MPYAKLIDKGIHLCDCKGPECLRLTPPVQSSTTCHYFVVAESSAPIDYSTGPSFPMPPINAPGQFFNAVPAPQVSSGVYVTYPTQPTVSTPYMTLAVIRGGSGIVFDSLYESVYANPIGGALKWQFQGTRTINLKY